MQIYLKGCVCFRNCNFVPSYKKNTNALPCNPHQTLQLYSTSNLSSVEKKDKKKQLKKVLSSASFPFLEFLKYFI